MPRPENPGQQGRDRAPGQQTPREDRGRSAEARDPNRPIDPETGEKMPLPDRHPDRSDEEAPESPEDTGA